MYTILLTASLASLALARTDLTGCTSTDVSSPAGASIAWYVPGTGEICEFLDCGGGRAPPKTTVPGCAAYVGTETYSPSYNTAWAAATSSAVEASSYASTSSSAPESYTSSSASSSQSAAPSSYSSDIIPASSFSSSVITAAPAPYASTYASNGTAGPGSYANGTYVGASGSMTSSRGRTGASSTSAPLSANAAVETGRVWMAGMGMIGLGAVVVAL